MPASGFRALSPVAEQPCLVALPVALGLGRAFVGRLLALGDAKQHLRDPALVEIEPERHDRHPLAGRRLPEPRKLPPVDQKFPWPALVMAEGGGLGMAELRDMRVDQPELAILHR